MKIIEKYYVKSHKKSYTCKECGAENTIENNSDFYKCYKCETRKPTWDCLIVSVMQRNEDGTEEKVGEYERTYSAMYNTFYPFTQNGKDYALISHTYTGTCVISLPDCKHVCGECEWKNAGFCPTGFYVPELDDDNDSMNGQLGFVCGCVWGDDGSWKIQAIDLSKISEGKMSNQALFGYCELPHTMGTSQLNEAIQVSKYDEGIYYVKIIHEESFKVAIDATAESKGLKSFSQALVQSSDDFVQLMKNIQNLINIKTKDKTEEEKVAILAKSELETKDIVKAWLSNFHNDVKKLYD